MASLLYILFFISGAAALIFEMLWFRQAGLALGNSVWASSLVLAGFMGGLALGNALAARYGARAPNPVRAYAVAETAIAVTGVGLVFLLPGLGAMLAPWLRPLLDHAWLLNPVRLGLAFLLLLVPSTAMGITLPLLTKALAVRGSAFGPALGRLYGWNTAGAVVGVAACEMYLIGTLGVHGTALLAAALNLGAAAMAAAIARDRCVQRRSRTRNERSRGIDRQAWTVAPRPWLTAAFLSGFCLLALEVVWFRFLLLFVKGHSVALALILALVLTGIALGGLLAGWWLRVSPAAYRFAALVAFVSGVALIVSYRLFPSLIGASPALVVDTAAILALGAPLILPVVLLLRDVLHDEWRGAADRAACRNHDDRHADARQHDRGGNRSTRGGTACFCRCLASNARSC